MRQLPERVSRRRRWAFARLGHVVVSKSASLEGEAVPVRSCEAFARRVSFVDPVQYDWVFSHAVPPLFLVLV